MNYIDDPHQGSAATLLHSIEYALVRGDIWQYRRLRGQYHREYYVTFAQWCYFLDVEERLAQSLQIDEPFRSGYLKCLALQAARDTGFPNFWLVFWRLACTDGSAREASQILLKEAVPDTFNAIDIFSHILNSPEFVLTDERWNGAEEQWELLASRYAPLDSENLCNIPANLPWIPQFGAHLANMIRHSPADTKGLQEGVEDIESTREPRPDQVDALLAWKKKEHSEYVYFSILRRLQRHPRLEGSFPLVQALISALCNVSSGVDPIVVETIALRTCQLTECDMTTRLLCIDLLCEVYLGSLNREREKTGRSLRTLHSPSLLQCWVRDAVPILLPPHTLQRSTRWTDITALHLHTYGMLGPYCGDERELERVYSILMENMAKCHGSSPLPTVPYLMLLARAEACYRRLGMGREREEVGLVLYNDLVNELTDPRTGAFCATKAEEMPNMIRSLLEIPWDESTLGHLYSALIKVLRHGTTAGWPLQRALEVIDVLLQALTRHGQTGIFDPTHQWRPFRHLLLLRTQFLALGGQREEGKGPRKGWDQDYDHLPKRARPMVEPDGEEEEPDSGPEDDAGKFGRIETVMEETSLDKDPPELKIFLSNLSFQATEAELFSFLRSHSSDCTGVRLIRDAHGQSKGVGHASFGSVSAAQDALRLDRILFEGRPLFLSPYQPVPRAQRQRTVSTTRNPRTLFLSHLPVDTTRDELLTILELESSTPIRLVPNKHIAYVECPSEETAAYCVRTHNGAVLRDTPIRVQISDPQAARVRATALSMLPRGVHSKRGSRLPQ